MSGKTRRLMVGVVGALWIIAACAFAGCWKRCGSSGAPVAAQMRAASAEIVVKDDSTGLLLSWIDEKGQFHVEEKVGDVPLAGRDAVRVVDPGRDESVQSDVLVADLRTLRQDGTYVTKRMTRGEFEALAVARRAKSTAKMPNAPGPVDDAPGSDDEASGERGESDDGTERSGQARRRGGSRQIAVIIYGASWCGACHQAAAFLKRKGIPYVEKDIEADASADREMRIKLAKAGMRGGSIPVLDVRGRMMVGFDPGTVEAALGERL